MISRRKFLKLSVAGAAGVVGAGLYTCCVEPHWLEVVQKRLPISGLPKDLKGCRVVQISDVHIGPRVSDEYLIDCFRQARALAPDFVVYTGDFTSYAPDVVEHTRAMFAHLPLGRRGTFGILGNHDYGPNWARPEVASQIAELARAVGVRILRNEVAAVDGLHFLGLDDLWAHRFDPRSALREFPTDAAALALSHNPDTADLPGWEAYSGWILAGHTHGGQCKPPFLPPPLLPVRNRRYSAGEFALPARRRMYINRGVGYLIGVRFNARPEITLFHLESA